MGMRWQSHRKIPIEYDEYVITSCSIDVHTCSQTACKCSQTDSINHCVANVARRSKDTDQKHLTCWRLNSSLQVKRIMNTLQNPGTPVDGKQSMPHHAGHNPRHSPILDSIVLHCWTFLDIIHMTGLVIEQTIAKENTSNTSIAKIAKAKVDIWNVRHRRFAASNSSQTPGSSGQSLHASMAPVEQQSLCSLESD